ncbi:haloacid dehalogenase type II [Deferribacter abyssi]|uniref:haloacid dehalogenase type II n=1 Tax=Deferribacter abyssi TaxID=213806 RepID=UPI003C1D9B7C
MVVLSFDVYGTLIDTKGVFDEIVSIVKDEKLALHVTDLWRQKQLEYSFRRALMQNYVDFSVCTKQALEYVNNYFNLNISEDEMKILLEKYKNLPPFDDVISSLNELMNLEVKMYAFSNGKPEDLNILLNNAGIIDYFEGIISVDDIKSFKPNPAVYAHFLRSSKAEREKAFMISANPFDVIGAISAGMSAIWVNRGKKIIFDPWELKPTFTINSLRELPKLLKDNYSC